MPGTSGRPRLADASIPQPRPILSLRGVARDYPSGDGALRVLDGIDLDIAPGEMVAIIGASGSGKSTLLNILGCLDRPSEGSYRVAGRETARLAPDELAELRREHFGFVFQRYNLLPELGALGNVEVPAVYAGTDRSARARRAAALLTRLGMGARLDHRPGQLSGGQQQRVSIARALMNDGEVILADEPTGALDSRSGEEVLQILTELNREGRTVVLVTHDPAVAARASRIVEISDGRIVSDRRTAEPGPRAAEGQAPRAAPRSAFLGGRLAEAFRMAWVAIAAHRLRSFLTMLGIIIGIASVVSVVALGQGSREQVLKSIAGLGTNTLEVFPGEDMGDVYSGRIRTLVASDAEALAAQPYAAAVSPTVQTSGVLRIGATEASVQVNGVGAAHFDARGIPRVEGSYFGEASVAAREQVVVIDTNTRDTVFPDEDPIGKVVMIGRAPFRVIGVGRRQGGWDANSLIVYVPYTSLQTRLTGEATLRSLILRVDDDSSMAAAETATATLLEARHGTRDFFIVNTDDIRQTITSTTETMTLLIAAIAVISLVVGGIGVMNIMLVSVSERIGEIGVRMAVGARRSDILQQFLVEAVLVCLVGGLLGLLLAFGFGRAFAAMSPDFAPIYSARAMIAAVVSASAIGIIFGFLPARRAAALDPVVALSRA